MLGAGIACDESSSFLRRLRRFCCRADEPFLALRPVRDRVKSRTRGDSEPDAHDEDVRRLLAATTRATDKLRSTSRPQLPNEAGKRANGLVHDSSGRKAID